MSGDTTEFIVEIGENSRQSGGNRRSKWIIIRIGSASLNKIAKFLSWTTNPRIHFRQKNLKSHTDTHLTLSRSVSVIHFVNSVLRCGGVKVA